MSAPSMTQDDTFPPRPQGQGDLAALARELVEKVGMEGAIRYCHSLGWGGVLLQVEKLQSKKT